MIAVTRMISVLDPHRESVVLEEYRGGTVGNYVPAGAVVYRNGSLCRSDDPVSDRDQLIYTARPGGLEGPALFVAQLLASVAVSFLLQNFFGPTLPSKRSDDEESPTYGFSGLRNNRLEGLPLQAYIGKMRVAPQVIAEFTRSVSSPPTTDYYVLLCFGEGPIRSIAGVTTDTDPLFPLRDTDPANPIPFGVEINGNDLRNFSNVEMHVRLGTDEQEVVPGFEEVRQQSAVEFLLRAPETTSPNNSQTILQVGSVAPRYNMPLEADPFWNQYGEAFTLDGDIYDEVVFIIDLRSGLFRVDANTGNLLSSNFDLIIRYRELDSLGNQIKTGGPDGDGWVRMFPEQRVVLKQRSPTTLEYGARFLDPQNYVYPTRGTALALDGSGHAIATTPMQLPTAWQTQATGLHTTGFTASTWVYVDDTTAPDNWVLGHFNTLGTRGWQVSIQRRSFSFGQLHAVPVVSVGTGSGVRDYWEQKLFGIGSPTFIVPQQSWFQLVLTMGTDRKATVYINGVALFSLDLGALGTPLETAGASSPFRVGSSPIGTGFMSGRVDETRILQRAMTAQEIKAAYNRDRGTHGTSETALVSGWHFNDTGPADDYSANYQNPLTLTGTVTSGVTAGIVFNPNSGTAKPGRYLVEVMRNNEDSTSTETSDDATWVAAVGVIDQEFSHPGLPLLGLKLRASEQLSGSAPTITSIIEGFVGLKWDGLSTQSPTVVEEYSNNPAWVALTIILNRRFGMGPYFDVPNVHYQSLQDVADRSDQLISARRVQVMATTGFTELLYVASPEPTNPLKFGFITVIFTEATWDAISRFVEVGAYVGFDGLNIIGGGGTPTGSPGTPGDDEDMNRPTDPADPNYKTPAGFKITGFNPAKGIAFAPNLTVQWDEFTYGMPFPAGQFLSRVTAQGETLTGTFEFRRKRFTFNGAYDTERGAWGVLLEVLGVARARPLKVGRNLRFKIEQPRLPGDIISDANIVEGSFEVNYEGLAGRDNEILAQFHDADLNWERVPEKLAHPSIENATSLSAIRRGSMFLVGCTSRAQALSELAYRLNINELIVESGVWVQNRDAVSHEVGDVVYLDHTLFGDMQTGRISVVDTKSSVKLDTEVVLASGKTYLFRIKNPRLLYFDTRTITSVAGTYPAGTALTLDSALSFVPAPPNVWRIVEDDIDRTAVVVDVGLTQEMDRRVAWAQYHAGIFDDQWFSDPDPNGLEMASQLQVVNEETIPGAVTDLTVSPVSRTGVSGAQINEAALGWKLDPGTLRAVREVRIWRKADRDGEPYVEVARLHGHATSAVIRLDELAYGATVMFAVQAVSFGGSSLATDSCTEVAMFVESIGVPPPAPAQFTAALSDEEAIYSWVPGADDRALVYQARRGGWLLGQVAFDSAQHSRHGPTRNFASGPLSLSGDQHPTLLLRAISPSGLQSSAATLATSFDPEVPGIRDLGNTIYEDRSWEDFSGAKTWVGGAESPTLLGGQVTDGYLEFDASSLLMTYETSVQVIDPTGEQGIPRHCFVEAFADAEQVHPATIEDFPPIGAPQWNRWSMEGPVLTLPGEPDNCGIAIQISLQTEPGAAYDTRRSFRPGIYRLVAAKFRLIFTRPSTAYNVRVFRFASRIRRLPKRNEERSQLTSIIHQQIFTA